MKLLIKRGPGAIRHLSSVNNSRIAQGTYWLWLVWSSLSWNREADTIKAILKLLHFFWKCLIGHCFPCLEIMTFRTTLTVSEKLG